MSTERLKELAGIQLNENDQGWSVEVDGQSVKLMYKGQMKLSVTDTTFDTIVAEYKKIQSGREGPK